MINLKQYSLTKISIENICLLLNSKGYIYYLNNKDLQGTHIYIIRQTNLVCKGINILYILQQLILNLLLQRNNCNEDIKHIIYILLGFMGLHTVLINNAILIQYYCIFHSLYQKMDIGIAHKKNYLINSYISNNYNHCTGNFFILHQNQCNKKVLHTLHNFQNLMLMHNQFNINHIQVLNEHILMHQTLYDSGIIHSEKLYHCIKHINLNKLNTHVFINYYIN